MAYKQEWTENFPAELRLNDDTFSQEENLKTISLLNETLNKFGIEVEMQENGSRAIFRKNEDFRTKTTRNAGKKRKLIGKLSLSEIEERIKKSSAEEVATEMGISRSTLFRRMKEAKECREDEIF